jgi:hypothetical protein
LYKEDFDKFRDALDEAVDFVRGQLIAVGQPTGEVEEEQVA